MRAIYLFPLLSFFRSSAALGLLEAISAFPELSNFTALYRANEAIASSLFDNKTHYPITVLIPSNNAFAAYQAQHNASFTDFSLDTLLPLIQYHTLVSRLTKKNFTANIAGLGTVPTLLQDSNNQRSVGSGLAARYGGQDRSRGQVVFVSGTASFKPSDSSGDLLLSRQDASPDTQSIRSGLGSTANLTLVDDDQGTWDGGSFHIIDNILTPPDLCNITIRAEGLSDLELGLNRTGLWPVLDGASNVTCLAPTNEAFKNGGSPQRGLSEPDLADALKFHTLPEVAYSDFLTDGQEFTSLGNMTVRVRVKREGAEQPEIWFNNAKVVDANVLTHNGLVHVLDAVMRPLEEMEPSPSSSPTESKGAGRLVSVIPGLGVLGVILAIFW